MPSILEGLILFFRALTSLEVISLLSSGLAALGSVIAVILQYNQKSRPKQREPNLTISMRSASGEIEKTVIESPEKIEQILRVLEEQGIKDVNSEPPKTKDTTTES